MTRVAISVFIALAAMHSIKSNSFAQETRPGDDIEARQTLSDEELLVLRDALSNDLLFGPSVSETGLLAKLAIIDPDPKTLKLISRLIEESGINEAALKYFLSTLSKSTAIKLLSLECEDLNHYHRAVLLNAQVLGGKLTPLEAMPFANEWSDVEGFPATVYCIWGDESKPGFHKALCNCLADRFVDNEELFFVLMRRHGHIGDGKVQLSELNLPPSRLRFIRESLEKVSKLVEDAND